MRDASNRRIKDTGFREYDARWKYPDDVNEDGIFTLGLSYGTLLHRRGIVPTVAVGNDYRSYSPSVKAALIDGLVEAGCQVKDIGMALSPMAYFSQNYLGTCAVAMVTASHNPNGWTGVKMGFDFPVTLGPDDMAELKEITLGEAWEKRSGGSVEQIDGVREAYIDDLVGDTRINRPLKVICATGNGTASDFAPEVLRRLGVEVVEQFCELDHSFPNYNPNPEAMEMLHDMADQVREHGADLAFGFDGDGDRCGIVDNEADEIFADKVGLIMARDLIGLYPGSTFVVDVKSTGLFMSDPLLKAGGATTDYWKTGHSHIKRRVRELNALAGFEKSGHYYLSGAISRGYDCGMRVAVELCKLMDRNPDKSMSDLKNALGKTWSMPTLSPFCPDTEKYGVSDRTTERLVEMMKNGQPLGGKRIVDVVTVNGARVMLEDGAWALVRASSNTPNLVVVCESPESEEALRSIFADTDAVLRMEPSVGDYDQTF